MKNLKSFVKSRTFVILGILLTEGYAQIVLPGPCKSVENVQNLVFKEVLGRWYEINKIHRTLEENEKCTEFDFWVTDGKMLTITRLYVSTVDGFKYNDTKSIPVNTKTAEGITIDGYPFKVIDTDYDKYATVYACQADVDIHRELAWVFTRERMPDEDTFSKAVNSLQKIGVPFDVLESTDHNGCPDNFNDAKNN